MFKFIKTAHDVFALAVLGRAVIQFANLPNAERAMLLYFIPPILAFLFITCDTGNFNPTVVRGCRLFLSTIAITVLLAELPFVLPNLKPQFPGLPRQADRTLVFYFGAYALFLWITFPAYVFGMSLYLHARGLPGGMSRAILYTGCVCWLLTVGLLVFAITTSGKLF